MQLIGQIYLTSVYYRRGGMQTQYFTAIFRFDKLIEVKMATDLESKICILKPICQKVNLAKDLSVEEIVIFKFFSKYIITGKTMSK